MRPDSEAIAVPPFPPATRWIGSEPPQVERICASGPLVVHFVDVAHPSSVRTLPYLRGWAKGYRDAGLTVIGVNSPRFPFTADPDKLAEALALLEVDFPVASDPSYESWHTYGCEGWPSLFLWSKGGALRWYHFGEGEYRATEEAIREELGGADLPEPMDALRSTDAPGAIVAVPSDEVFPGGSISDPWVATPDEPPIELDYEAGEAWASVDGSGSLTIGVDDAAPTRIEVTAPGAYRLAGHDRHEAHGLSVAATPGVAVHSIGFTAGVREGST
ncbi:MAG: hypothetical protein ACRDK1_06210 [Solirubrobacterales bacterium]